ncbi:LapA family protein [Streptomyces sp. CC210A]|nr:LapA family protein [Streptomyces sp. CC210A]
MTPSRITAAVLAVLAVVLIVENTREVEIRLLIPVVTMPLYLALLIMFVIGGLCGALLIRGRGR